MAVVLLRGWDGTNDVWIPLAVDTNGNLKIDMANIDLGDLGDVSVATPTDGYVLYWDNATSLWKCKAISTTFLALTDTPASFVDQARKLLAVNAGEDAVEFLSGKAFYAITPVNVYSFSALPIGDNPRTATVSSVSGDVITLTGNHAYRFWDVLMDGNCYLKIANTSKSPTEYAWVKARPAANQLQVTDEDDISGWVNTDTISTQTDDAYTTDHQVDLSPTIPAGATGVFLASQARDSGTITNAVRVLIRQEVGGLYSINQCQVTDILSDVFPFMPVDSNRCILFRVNASGVDTLKTWHRVVAYVK